MVTGGKGKKNTGVAKTIWRLGYHDCWFIRCPNHHCFHQLSTKYFHENTNVVNQIIDHFQYYHTLIVKIIPECYVRSFAFGFTIFLHMSINGESIHAEEPSTRPCLYLNREVWHRQSIGAYEVWSRITSAGEGPLRSTKITSPGNKTSSKQKQKIKP